jgi:hypothetical protein
MATNNAINAPFPFTFAQGGTNNASLTASNGGIAWSDASKLNILAGTATAQQLLMSGASTTPQWSTTTYPLTNAINTIMYASAANVLGVITPANNAILTSNASGVPSWSTSATVMSWTDVTGTSQAAVVNNGYIADNAGLCTITLPSTAAIGQIVAVQGKGAGGWKLAQNASQAVNFGNQVTTTGTGGSLASTNQWDAVEVICVTANNVWAVMRSIGNITVT